MADASHSDLIAQFTGVTGVDAERAKFYLESAAWKLDVALSSFYDGGEMGDDDDDDIVEASPAANVPTPQPTHAATAAPQPKPQQPKSRIATLGSMRQEESDDSEEEGQAFYAGGSERSGQQVLGPPRKKKQSTDEFVQNMFKAARDHGGEEVEEPSSTRARPSVFRGTGYRLGDSDDAPIDVVSAGSVDEEVKQVDVVLKLWKNGFSVDDGPLRDYQDPANKDFLQSIHKGEIPRELLRMARGGEVNLNMEDHRHEDFVKPKGSMKAFTGEGHMLGSPAPNVVGAAAAAAGASSGQQSEAAAKATVAVDDSKPTTNLQIRLADGARLVAKFNHSHTIGDVRTYITTAQPQFAGTSFVLMTTFPNKELTDESQTLEDAKLLNSVIVQRLK